MITAAVAALMLVISAGPTDPPPPTIDWPDGPEADLARAAFECDGVENYLPEEDTLVIDRAFQEDDDHLTSMGCSTASCTPA
jgi:hypothetical protein